MLVMNAKVTQPLNAAQIELLNSVAHIESEEAFVS